VAITLLPWVFPDRVCKWRKHSTKQGLMPVVAIHREMTWRIAAWKGGNSALSLRSAFPEFVWCSRNRRLKSFPVLGTQ
jgi:hypothetical protein